MKTSDIITNSEVLNRLFNGNEMSCPAWGLDMAEAIAADHRAKFPNDKTEIVEQENRDEIQAYWDKEYAKTLNA